MSVFDLLTQAEQAINRRNMYELADTAAKIEEELAAGYFILCEPLFIILDLLPARYAGIKASAANTLFCTAGEGWDAAVRERAIKQWARAFDELAIFRPFEGELEAIADVLEVTSYGDALHALAIQRLRNLKISLSVSETNKISRRLQAIEQGHLQFEKLMRDFKEGRARKSHDAMGGLLTKEAASLPARPEVLMKNVKYFVRKFRDAAPRRSFS